ncbi:MAG: AAA family ATPase [Actinomycetota bacterium]|nr:AAA family ATPase [Actinomycetota bacterium]
MTGSAQEERGVARGGLAMAVETHMSVLFFYGDRVLKVRRPVEYGFADFSDPARRRADCDREVELNRRLSPDVYLGTATISLGDEVLEHGVLMRRLPADRNLERLVRRGEPVDTELREVARALARLHEHAARSATIDASATAEALWQRWQATEESLSRFVGSFFDGTTYRELTARARRYLDGRRELFEERIQRGAVCDGHGDLQASDIFCLADGPRILDCLEFDDELRYGDVLADAAFLAFDLERLGAAELADAFLADYGRESGVEQPPSLVHFYVATRAHVRLLVACLRLELGLDQDRSEPERLVRLAGAHLEKALPRMVLVGGPPGSGKTTLAEWLGQRLDAEVLSTDHLRAEGRAEGQGEGRVEGHGVGEREPAGSPEDRYSEAARAAVYDSMLERARVHLHKGRSVVLDATWQTVTLRRMAAAVARETSADQVELRCDAPRAHRRARVVARLQRGGSESEATAEVAETLAAEEEPWPTATLVDTSGTVEEARSAAARALGLVRAA